LDLEALGLSLLKKLAAAALCGAGIPDDELALGAAGVAITHEGCFVLIILPGDRVITRKRK